jgi:hypothetical protein
MQNMINYLMKNPQEAYAVASGNSTPLGLNVKEILKVIQFFSNQDNDKIKEPVRGYWT